MNVTALCVLTYQPVLFFNWTAVTQKSRLQVDFHYVSTGGAAENELIILCNLCGNMNIQNERITV